MVRTNWSADCSTVPSAGQRNLPSAIIANRPRLPVSTQKNASAFVDGLPAPAVLMAIGASLVPQHPANCGNVGGSFWGGCSLCPPLIGGCSLCPPLIGGCSPCPPLI